MADHLDRFHAALLVLAGHGHVKQRLIKAFEEHLNDIHEDELPVASRQSFADLRHELHRVSPLNGEGPICASVRKMSLSEAGECAGRIVTLYGELARYEDLAQSVVPAGAESETHVPPFLVKSV
jgi:hypothetical protein